MRATTGRIVVSALLLLGAASAGEGQVPASDEGAGFWKWALGDMRNDLGAGGQARVARSGGGPAYCRSGLGHPVHGRAWCLREGFGLGPVPWVRARLGDLPLGRSDLPPRFDGRLGARDLRAILGDAALERLLARAGAGRSSSFLNGRWQERAGPADARILQVRIVDRPLAELNDIDADGRAEEILIYRPGRG